METPLSRSKGGIPVKVFGKFLADYLKHEGESQTAFSARTGIHYRKINGLIAGTIMARGTQLQENVSFDFADKILCAADISPLVWHQPPLGKYALEAIRHADSLYPTTVDGLGGCCRNGHERTTANTVYMDPKNGKSGYRRCRDCQRETQKRRKRAA
jgi:hypothetical protein